MPVRTGAEYLAGLRDGRMIWLEGERVADVTTLIGNRSVPWSYTNNLLDRL